MNSNVILTILFVSVNLWFRSCRAVTCLTECPKVCNCNSIKPDRCEVICTNQHLNAIPTKFPVEATLIDLSDNDLRTIPAKYFMNLTHLHILRFDNNQLSSLHKDAFKGLSSLRELSLEHNKLFLNNQTFTQDLFSDLIKLKVLKLRHNHILNGDYIEQAVSVLSALEDLQIVCFNNTLFGPAYRNLTHLKYLTLTENVQNKYIREKTFENVPLITFLNLSYSNIFNIHKNTFSYLKSLAVLDLSFNRRFTFHNVGIALYGLRSSTSLQSLNISAVHVHWGLGTELKREDTISLQNTTLKEIRVDSNKREVLEVGVISFLPKTLEYASLVDNKLVFSLYLYEIANLKNIRVIDASFMYSAQRHIFDSKPIDKSIMMNRRFTLPSSLQRFTLPSSMQRFLVRNSFIIIDFNNIDVVDAKLLQFIDLSGNYICPWGGYVTGLEHIRGINISNNKCGEFVDTVFSFFKGLQFLDLHGNLLGLSNVAKNNAFNTTFQNLTLLEELQLSDNHIENIANNSLVNSPNITSLDLSNNLLKTFSLTISHMTNLSRLDLSNNRLQELSENTRHDIELVSKGHRLIVDLSMNDLRCTCQHRSFLWWLREIRQSNNTVVISTECTLPNNTVRSLEGNNLLQIIEYLDKYCFSMITIIMVAIGLIMSSISLFTAALVYRFRWNLRYFYYMVKIRYSHLPNENDDYVFDAFVVYAEEDRNFVLRSLIPELEERSNFKLNIHHRDFMVGNLILENILEAIQKSRKCLILLSRHLLASEWCMYEFNMAKMESVYSNRDVVVTVMLEDVAESSMSLQLLHHIKTHSYIEFPAENQQGQLVFWDSLKRSL